MFINDNSLGDTIRLLRKKKGLSQEDLADGICSVVSISRIENGTQMPSANVLEQLLERLDSGIYQLCRIYYDNDQKRHFQHQASHIIRLYNMDEAGQKEALKLFNDLEQNEEPYCQQVYHFLDACLLTLQTHDYQEVITKLNQALAISNIDIDDFENKLLDPLEISILNMLGTCYFVLEEQDKALKIHRSLVSYLGKQNKDLKSICILNINVLYNLVDEYLYRNDFDSAQQYLTILKKQMQESFEYLMESEIYYLEALLLKAQGKEEKADKLIEALKLVITYQDKEHLLDFIEEDLNGEKRQLHQLFINPFLHHNEEL